MHVHTVYAINKTYESNFIVRMLQIKYSLTMTAVYKFKSTHLSFFVFVFKKLVVLTGS